MGIPSYFYKISNQYKNVITPNIPNCDRLFLDYNGIIHTCCHTLRAEVSVDLPVDEFETQLMHRVLKYTDHIFKKTLPKVEAHICIDGVAPIPKIKQQRKRRYTSSFIKSQLTDGLYEWDTNAISPGTKFMKRLDTFLKEAFEGQHTAFPVFVSGSDEKGEGEHKIFNKIHNSPSALNYVDIVYGLDADLIMLSLICKGKNIHLLREPQHFNSKLNSEFLVLHINKLYNSVIEYYQNQITIESYVFICFLLGNDFLPNLTYLTIYNNGIEEITNAYLSVYRDTNMNIIEWNENKQIFQINTLVLSKLFEKLASKETSEFQKCHEKYYANRFTFKTDKLKLDNYGVVNKSNHCKNLFSNNNWRKNYYIELFNMNVYVDKVVSKVTNSYLLGLVWNADYYFNKICRNYWYYPYDYSPTIIDISNQMMTDESIFHENNPDKTIDLDITPEMQLLMIMPIQSKGLLSESNQLVMTNMCTRYMFPTNFKMETYQKNKLHECHPQIPQINVNKLFNQT